MPSQHAILAPSASKRWMTCTPSARQEAKYPSKDSVFSREGTIAHALAEFTLNYFLEEKAVYVPEFEVFQKRMRQENPSLLLDLTVQCTDEGFDFWDIFEIVYNNYVTIVYEDFLNVKKEFEDAELLVEAELNLKSYIPESFGSSDAVLIYGEILKVYDLKFGQGVKVEAENNTQMLCYALGALLGPAELNGIDTVQMTIIQPRLQHISSWSISADKLIQWATYELKPAALKAFNGEGEYVPGDHCKFCRIAPRCRACALRATILAESNSEPSELTDEELADLLYKLESIKNWTSKVEEYALQQAVSGHAIPGWKVVEGRSISKIQDQQSAMADLFSAGFEKDLVCKPVELKGITDLKKILRPKGFEELLGKYVVKPQGKPTLAPVSDKRPEMNNIEGDFNNVIL
ncbi:MAG: DUF2800 domain-containing protein [Bacteroidales bacterium]|nr:DUF2800 domain-containing protein [Candidatus Cryptobacteroides faecihippi]